MANEQATLTVGIDPTKAVSGARRFTSASKRAGDAAGRFGKQVNTVDKRLNKLGKTSGNVGQILTGTFAGIGGAVVLKQVISTFTAFEDTMNTAGLVAKSTTMQFKDLSEEARLLGATTRFSAKEAADGILFLSRAGFSTSDTLATIGDTLDLAAAGAIGLGEAADFASNILQGFSLSAGEMERVVDTLVDTSNAANTTVTQLAEAMKFVAPVSAALGRSIEETAAAIGVLGDAGIQGTMAGTTMRAAMLRLLSPTEAARKAIEGIGLDLEDLNPISNSIADIFETLSEVVGVKGRDAFAKAASEIFGVRQVSGALVLATDASVKKMRELTRAMEETSGTASDMATAMSDDLEGAFKNLKSAVSELFLVMGDEGMLGAMRTIVDFSTDVVRALAGMEDQFIRSGESAKRIAEFLKVAAKVAAVFIGLKLASTALGIARAMGAAAIGASTLSASLSALAFPLAIATAAYLLLKDTVIGLGHESVTFGDLTIATLIEIGDFLDILARGAVDGWDMFWSSFFDNSEKAFDDLAKIAASDIGGGFISDKLKAGAIGVELILREGMTQAAGIVGGIASQKATGPNMSPFALENQFGARRSVLFRGAEFLVGANEKRKMVRDVAGLHLRPSGFEFDPDLQQNVPTFGRTAEGEPAGEPSFAGRVEQRAVERARARNAAKVERDALIQERQRTRQAREFQQELAFSPVTAITRRLAEPLLGEDSKLLDKILSVTKKLDAEMKRRLKLNALLRAQEEDKVRLIDAQEEASGAIVLDLERQLSLVGQSEVDKEVSSERAKLAKQFAALPQELLEIRQDQIEELVRAIRKAETAWEDAETAAQDHNDAIQEGVEGLKDMQRQLSDALKVAKDLTTQSALDDERLAVLSVIGVYELLEETTRAVSESQQQEIEKVTDALKRQREELKEVNRLKKAKEDLANFDLNSESDNVIKDLRTEIEGFGKSDLQTNIEADFAGANAALETLTAMETAAGGATDASRALREELEGFKNVIGILEVTSEVLKGFGQIMQDVSKAFSTAISDVLLGVTSVDDAFRQLGINLMETIVRRMVQQVTDAIADLILQLTKQLVISGLTALFGGAIGGGAFPSTAIVDTFAEGGIIDKPTRALMGEAGPEAVMPLRRGSDGKLGVSVQGLLSEELAAESIRATVGPIDQDIFALAMDIKHEFQALRGDLEKILAPRRFAEGGIVTRATLGIVGEAGPEAIIPLRNLPQYQNGGIGNEDKDRNVTINMTVKAVDAASFRRSGGQIARDLRRMTSGVS